MLTSITYTFDLLNGMPKNERKTFEQGAVGVRLIADLYEGITSLDISAATTIEFCAVAPSGAVKALTGTFVTDGTDGQFYHDTVLADFDEAGSWKIAVHLIAPTYERKSPSYHIQLVNTSVCP